EQPTESAGSRQARGTQAGGSETAGARGASEGEKGRGATSGTATGGGSGQGNTCPDIACVLEAGPLAGRVQVRGRLRRQQDAVDRHADHWGKCLHRVGQCGVHTAETPGPAIPGESAQHTGMKSSSLF